MQVMIASPVMPAMLAAPVQAAQESKWVYYVAVAGESMWGESETQKPSAGPQGSGASRRCVAMGHGTGTPHAIHDGKRQAVGQPGAVSTATSARSHCVQHVGQSMPNTIETPTGYARHAPAKLVAPGPRPNHAAVHVWHRASPSLGQATPQGFLAKLYAARHSHDIVRDRLHVHNHVFWRHARGCV